MFNSYNIWFFYRHYGFFSLILRNRLVIELYSVFGHPALSIKILKITMTIDNANFLFVSSPLNYLSD